MLGLSDDDVPLPSALGCEVFQVPVTLFYTPTAERLEAVDEVRRRFASFVLCRFCAPAGDVVFVKLSGAAFVVQPTLCFRQVRASPTKGALRGRQLRLESGSMVCRALQQRLALLALSGARVEQPVVGCAFAVAFERGTAALVELRPKFRQEVADGHTLLQGVKYHCARLLAARALAFERGHQASTAVPTLLEDAELLDPACPVTWQAIRGVKAGAGDGGAHLGACRHSYLPTVCRYITYFP